MFEKSKNNLIYLFNKYFKKTNKGIIILTYHGVVNKITNPSLQRNFHTITQFDNHIQFLKKEKYYFLNSKEISYYIENPGEIKNKKLVCITFDDGYQNNLEAINILNKHKVSGIFFISSQSINTNTSIWTVNLSLLLLKGSLYNIEFNNTKYSLETDDQRLKSFSQIRNDLKNNDATQRRLLYDEIVNQYPAQELEILIEKYNFFKMLTWDEIKNVKSENIQFQSHGNYHEIHNENQDMEILKNEIIESKKIIENHLNENVFLFAYPNGNYNENSATFLFNSGYKSAFILEESKFNNKHNRYYIPRITPNGKLQKFKNQII